MNDIIIGRYYLKAFDSNQAYCGNAILKPNGWHVKAGFHHDVVPFEADARQWLYSHTEAIAIMPIVDNV